MDKIERNSNILETAHLDKKTQVKQYLCFNRGGPKYLDYR